jgi:hypothetical protein
MTDVPSEPLDLSALPAMLTVGETAEVLRVGRSWVYEHAAQLGAVKFGGRKTAPLRIPRDGLRRMLGLPTEPMEPTEPAAPRSAARRSREATASTGVWRARPRL